MTPALFKNLLDGSRFPPGRYLAARATVFRPSRQHGGDAAQGPASGAEPAMHCVPNKASPRARAGSLGKALKGLDLPFFQKERYTFHACTVLRVYMPIQVFFRLFGEFSVFY